MADNKKSSNRIDPISVFTEIIQDGNFEIIPVSSFEEFAGKLNSQEIPDILKEIIDDPKFGLERIGGIKDEENEQIINFFGLNRFRCTVNISDENNNYNKFDFIFDNKEISLMDSNNNKYIINYSDIEVSFIYDILSDIITENEESIYLKKNEYGLSLAYILIKNFMNKGLIDENDIIVYFQRIKLENFKNSNNNINTRRISYLKNIKTSKHIQAVFNFFSELGKSIIMYNILKNYGKEFICEPYDKSELVYSLYSSHDYSIIHNFVEEFNLINFNRKTGYETYALKAACVSGDLNLVRYLLDSYFINDDIIDVEDIIKLFENISNPIIGLFLIENIQEKIPNFIKELNTEKNNKNNIDNMDDNDDRGYEEDNDNDYDDNEEDNDDDDNEEDNDDDYDDNEEDDFYNDYNNKNSEYNFFHYAIKGEHIEVIEFLLRKVAQVLGEDEMKKMVAIVQNKDVKANKETLLFYAIDNDKLEIVKLFILKLSKEELNSIINNRYKNKKTLLHYAIEKEDAELVKYLLSCLEINVNAKDAFGNTPFFTAVKTNNPNIIKILLNCNKVDINKANKYGEIPLSNAIKNENMEIIQILINHPNINLNDSFVSIPSKIELIPGGEEIIGPWAVSVGRRGCFVDPRYEAAKKKAVAEFIAERKNLEKIQYSKRVPLHTAIETGNIDIIKFFLNKNEADINKQDALGKTPLMIALEKQEIFYIVSQKYEGYSLEIIMENFIKKDMEIIKQLSTEYPINCRCFSLSGNPINYRRFSLIERYKARALIYENEKNSIEVIKLLLQQKNLKISEKEKNKILELAEMDSELKNFLLEDPKFKKLLSKEDQNSIDTISADLQNSIDSNEFQTISIINQTINNNSDLTKEDNSNNSIKK